MIEAQQIESLRKVKGFVHSQETFGTVDGPGIRYVLFLQGCPLRCLYCHNPDSLPLYGGEEWTAGDIADEIMLYKTFIKKGGVTFSGGEPLIQADFVTAVSKLLHMEGLHVAIDTAGSEAPSEVKQALDEADLILLDIKALDPVLCKKISGKDNTNALATLDYCEKIGKPVWVRHVILNGYTLDAVLLEEFAKFLVPYSCVQRVELLPFHKMGEHKWQSIGRRYKLTDVPATSPEEHELAKRIFEKHGLRVQ